MLGMKKSTALTVISSVAFVISALFTMIWFTSDTQKWISLAFWLNVGMSLIFESFKIGSGYLAVVEIWIPKPFRVALGVISISLFLYSIIASAGYLTNVSSANKNKELKSSLPYQQQLQAKTDAKSRIESIKQEKAKLEASKDEIQAKSDDIVNSMPSNYRDRRNAQKASALNDIKEVQAQINKLDAEESKLTSDVQKPIDVSNIKFMSEKGGTSLFQTMANALNSEENKDDPFTPNGIEMTFKFIASIIFELIAWICAILAKMAKDYENGTYSPTPIDPNKKKKPEIELPKQTLQQKEIESGRLQGLKLNNEDVVHVDKSSNLPKRVYKIKKKKVEQAKTNVVEFKNKSSVHVDKSPQICINTKVERSFTDDDVRRYLEVMYRTQSKSGNSIGFRQIGNQIGIDAKTAEKIKGYLETIGIVKSLNGRTRILKEEA